MQRYYNDKSVVYKDEFQINSVLSKYEINCILEGNKLICIFINLICALQRFLTDNMEYVRQARTEITAGHSS